jgi:hypothetical protein
MKIIDDCGNTGQIMIEQNEAILDEMIIEEKRRVAVEFFRDAWFTALEEGIEPHILAESAMYTALSELTRNQGESSVSAIVNRLPQQVENGEFLIDRVIQ